MVKLFWVERMWSSTAGIVWNRYLHIQDNKISIQSQVSTKQTISSMFVIQRTLSSSILGYHNTYWLMVWREWEKLLSYGPSMMSCSRLVHAFYSLHKKCTHGFQKLEWIKVWGINARWIKPVLYATRDLGSRLPACGCMLERLLICQYTVKFKI